MYCNGQHSTPAGTAAGTCGVAMCGHERLVFWHISLACLRTPDGKGHGQIMVHPLPPHADTGATQPCPVSALHHVRSRTLQWAVISSSSRLGGCQLVTGS